MNYVWAVFSLFGAWHMCVILRRAHASGVLEFSLYGTYYRCEKSASRLKYWVLVISFLLMGLILLLLSFAGFGADL